jgi:hypothetical protein
VVQVLLEYVSTADDLASGQQFIVDGTLLPCWSWAARPDLYSGKHKTTGMKVLVACTRPGTLALGDKIDFALVHGRHLARTSRRQDFEGPVQESLVWISHGCQS